MPRGRTSAMSSIPSSIAASGSRMMPFVTVPQLPITIVLTVDRTVRPPSSRTCTRTVSSDEITRPAAST